MQAQPAAFVFCSPQAWYNVRKALQTRASQANRPPSRATGGSGRVLLTAGAGVILGVFFVDTIIQALQKQVRSLCSEEGGSPAGIPFVTAWRFTGERLRMPQTENPYLYLVLGGVLRLYTPSGIMDYMAGQCSVSQIDTPLSGTILTPSEKGDFLALSLEFTVNDVITAVLGPDNSLTEKILEVH